MFVRTKPYILTISGSYLRTLKNNKKKSGEMGFLPCGAFCPLFVSIGEVKKVVMAQGFVFLYFKMINENNVQ